MLCARHKTRAPDSLQQRIAQAIGFIALLLLVTSAFAEPLLPAGKNEVHNIVLSRALSTQAITIVTDTTQLIDSVDDVSKLELLTNDGTWHLSLQQHALLGDSNALQRALHDIPRFHQGAVSGDRDSWVRLSQTTKDGVQIFDGFIERRGQLYRLHPSSSIDTSSQTQSGHAKHQLTKLGHSDVLFQDNWQPRAVISQAVTRAARIGIAVDSRFNEFHGGRGLAQALTIINGVDGLYQSQFGLALIVDNIRVYDDPETDPLREQLDDVEALLTTFRSTRLTDAELPTSLALVHLFSGHQDPMQIIGLGWIDTACRTDGYDVSMSTPFPFDMLLAAHEIAHNLGALHDDDAECQMTGDVFESNVMWSQLSSATSTEFSSCSLQRVLPTLEKSCFAENIDVNVSLLARPSSSPLARHIEVQISNPDLTRTAVGMRTDTRFPENTILSDASAGCTIEETQLVCRHGAIAAGGQDFVSVHALLAGFDDQQVVTQLITDNFEDAQDADNRAALNVLQVTGSAVSGVPSDDAPNNGNASSGGNAGAGGIGAWLLSVLGLVFIRRTTTDQAGNSTAA